MTSENKAKLDTMMYEIIDFLAQLSEDHPDFDITSIKVKVERHRDDEVYKDTDMEFTVKDCGTASDELVTDDFNSYSVNTDDSDNDNDNIDPVPGDKTAIVTAQPSQEIERSETPEVVWLQLPENGNEMLRYLKKRRGEKPFLMYMSNLRQFLLP